MMKGRDDATIQNKKENEMIVASLLDEMSQRHFIWTTETGA
jgi:hypothetical protein